MTHRPFALYKDTEKSSKECFSQKENFHISHFRLDISGYRQSSMTIEDRSIVLNLESTRQSASCPYCGSRSSHYHSSYMRKIQSLEVYGYSCSLRVRVRKFRCKNPTCGCSIFSESLTNIAARYSRKTFEVAARIRQVSSLSTSRIASGLLSLQNIHCSASTCLRSVLHENPQSSSTPRPTHIGIDDFAQKKGHKYMSVVVDHLTGKPVAILPCREGKELDEYLLSNPQIQYVTRDRGRCYTEALNRCLPHATQITDRYHLVNNMVTGMAEEISSQARLDVQKLTYTPPSREECRRKIMEDMLNMADGRHRKKLQLFIFAEDAARKGVSMQETARRQGVHPMQIRKILYKHNLKDYMTPQQRKTLRYIDELAMHISQGCFNFKKLKEKMGTLLDSKTLSRATIGIRNMIKQQKNEIKEHNRNVEGKKKRSHATMENIHKFILTGKSSCSSLTDLLQKEPMRKAIKLCMEFRSMMNRNPHVRSLDKWLKEALNSPVEAMRKFARGIELDKEAVQAAIDIYLNNAILEGTVNKAKCLKRQMYNRAGPKLLMAKVIAFST